ncbi:GGDEF domain-containing protein [Massilia sp. TS11]|uniref:GGDEF domain-containing protein n=1 Tax=Massilia sp. TS11 TaxID=2908003 RepID=UPI001EDB0CB4|nr:GGDEF domain-containing protein [Massilia sp. TS11]MCG2584743.1 diguanylate cyclase [Massilia sp. TS11]
MTTSVPGFANQLLELLVIPAFVLDAERRVLIWNRACETLTGVAAEEVIGTTGHWRAFYVMPQATLADAVLDGTLPRGPRQAAEYWCEMPRTGRRCFLSVDASPMLDAQGKLLAVVSTLRDRTEEKQAQAALEQLATRDSLTGLANRRCFDQTLHAEWQRAMRDHQPLSLLMVDVDHFKQYNDTNGHLGGDDCLKRIAQAVAREMRTNDLVARYGGEEFAVILPNQHLRGAAIVAERIRARVEALGLSTVSIGAATAVSANGNDPGALVASADAALYRAKHLGRNRISLPLPEPALG